MNSRGITRDLLREHLSYDAVTGRLTWKSRVAGSPFCHHKSVRRWNSRYAGKPADDSFYGTGYRRTSLGSKRYMSHRLIWVMVHGEWPENIDHINGERTDNRICNLRNVSVSENNRNQALKSNNTSGVTGVVWCKSRSLWQAQVRIGDRTVFLGRYVDIFEAIMARKRAEIQYGFHANHGRMPTNETHSYL